MSIFERFLIKFTLYTAYYNYRAKFFKMLIMWIISKIGLKKSVHFWTLLSKNGQLGSDVAHKNHAKIQIARR